MRVKQDKLSSSYCALVLLAYASRPRMVEVLGQVVAQVARLAETRQVLAPDIVFVALVGVPVASGQKPTLSLKAGRLT